MFVKKALLYIPIILTFILIQSFFWVPTYDKQATGSPARLLKYINGSAADAQILNPILSADTQAAPSVTLFLMGSLTWIKTSNIDPGWRNLGLNMKKPT